MQVTTISVATERTVLGLLDGSSQLMLKFLNITPKKSLSVFLGILFAGLFIIGKGTAKGDVPARQYRGVTMNVGSRSGPGQESVYRSMIQHLRAAASHNFRADVTQTQNGNDSLIQLTFTAFPESSADRLYLWITPQDLYVRGFTTPSGRTYEFNDTTGDPTGRGSLQNLLRGLTNLDSPHTANDVTVLRFGGNYASLTRAAGVGLGQLRFSYDSFTNAVNTLAGYEGRQQGDREVARALLLMIQLTSEAARFNPVYDFWAAIMRGVPGNDRLPPRLDDLEHNWGHLSRFASNISTHPNAEPLNIPGLDNFRSFADVARVVAVIGNAAIQSNSAANLRHDEL